MGLQVIGLIGMCLNLKPCKQIYAAICGLFLIGCTIIAIILLSKWKEVYQTLSRCGNITFDLKFRWKDEFLMNIQKENQCCGITSKRNWGWGSMAYPPSCCKYEPLACFSPYEEPCVPFLAEHGNWLWIIVIGSMFSVVFLSPVVLVCMFYQPRDRIIREPFTVI
ncbi:hypothetical protein RF11_07082 [Thelohanellus kitauei]|uniref:Tetraspanin n=1 Tax=Thelohanellus kitauei TaxID=669202 RepID=A0A0C2MCZ2_THEKT|nr:hypothetical protein RF11_07082 [Thelohanellus kitauei]